MNKINTKFYYVLLLFCFFTFFFFNEFLEFFTINETSDYSQQKTTGINQSDCTSNVILSEVVSQNDINNLSSSDKIDLNKSNSLRNDKEFQESIARMEELIEYSRNTDITEEITIQPIVITYLTESEAFERGLDPKFIDRKIVQEASEAEYFSKFSNYFDEDTSGINIDDKLNVNNKSSVFINEPSVNIAEKYTDSNAVSDTDSDVVSDTQIELDFNILCDSDSDVESISISDYQSNSLSSQKDASSSFHTPSHSYNPKNTLFTKEEYELATKLSDQTSKYLTKSGYNLPTFKNSYTSEELGLGNPYSSRSSDIPQRPNASYVFPTYSKTAGMASSMGSVTKYESSYLASLDKDLQNIIGIKSDNTLETGKEVARESDREFSQEFNKDKEQTKDKETTKTEEDATTYKNTKKKGNLKRKIYDTTRGMYGLH